MSPVPRQTPEHPQLPRRPGGQTHRGLPEGKKTLTSPFVPRNVSVTLDNSLQCAFTWEKGKKKKASCFQMLKGRQLTAYF